MNRRDFVKKMPAMGALPFVLNGIPFSQMLGNNAINKMAANCPTDRVLILIQMMGGNDGLNTVIPISDYDLYYNLRANIAIPDNGARKYINLDSTLAANKQAGLHPDMIGMKQLYDEGMLTVVQGVSYENHNQSHFRGRDVLYMGGGANDYLNSGWAGRYLKENYQPKSYPVDFPYPDMQDPLALEFGNEISLVFHQGDNIPTSVSIYSPEQFYDLVDNLPGFKDTDERGLPPDSIKDSPYGQELNWILGLEQKTDQYHSRLVELYRKGQSLSSGATYPVNYPYNAPVGSLKNPLSSQLQIIANLIHGGCKTKVYLIRIGGFDTHAQQVESYDHSMGSHAALLYHLSSAMKAFQDDLKIRGIEDRVLSLTTSEFGRRIASNGSAGTDHGIGAPMFIFGKSAAPGIIGNTPDLNKENVEMQYDYRQVYATIMKEWMCVDSAIVDSVIFQGDYIGKSNILPIVDSSLTGVDEFISKRFKLNNCYPNPASFSTTFSFMINASTFVELKIFDNQGREVKTVLQQMLNAGEHRFVADLSSLKQGNYFYKIKAGVLKDSKQLIIIR